MLLTAHGELRVSRCACRSCREPALPTTQNASSSSGVSFARFVFCDPSNSETSSGAPNFAFTLHRGGGGCPPPSPPEDDDADPSVGLPDDDDPDDDDDEPDDDELPDCGSAPFVFSSSPNPTSALHATATNESSERKPITAVRTYLS